MSQTVFVVDLYDKFSSDKVISKHRINGRWWAIKEAPLLWGVPQLAKIEEDNPMSFHLYNSPEEAEQYIRELKRLEGVRF